MLTLNFSLHSQSECGSLCWWVSWWVGGCTTNFPYLDCNFFLIYTHTFERTSNLALWNLSHHLLKLFPPAKGCVCVCVPVCLHCMLDAPENCTKVPEMGKNYNSYTYNSNNNANRCNNENGISQAMPNRKSLTASNNISNSKQIRKQPNDQLNEFGKWMAAVAAATATAATADLVWFVICCMLLLSCWHCLRPRWLLLLLLLERCATSVACSWWNMVKGTSTCNTAFCGKETRQLQ